jgi:hypothetical protein
MSANTSVQRSIAFDEELYRRLEEEARASERSLNGEVRHRLRKSFERQQDEQTA